VALLFGRAWSRSELPAHVGDLAQVAGIRLGEWSDGVEQAVRVADVGTGSGLDSQCCWIAPWTWVPRSRIR
jgi:hypothetical protein